MWWPYVWIAFMLGLVITTTVIAMREKKARTAAIKKMTPQPIAGGSQEAIPAALDDSFGEQDPLDSFGADAAFDEDAFK